MSRVCDASSQLPEVASSSLEAWPISERPRERLAGRGAAALSDVEILALVIGSGHRCAGGAMGLAARLLTSFGGLRGVVGASRGELGALAGVGGALSARIQAAGELARRLSAEHLEAGAVISSSQVVHAHFGPMLADERREIFWALLLDTRNRVVAKVRVSEGSLGAALVHPREAFRPAIREAAASVIFLHNHPSGDPSPSMEDRLITARLRRAGELLGIPLLDHVVVARSRYYSFADSGWQGC